MKQTSFRSQRSFYKQRQYFDVINESIVNQLKSLMPNKEYHKPLAIYTEILLKVFGGFVDDERIQTSKEINELKEKQQKYQQEIRKYQKEFSRSSNLQPQSNQTSWGTNSFKFSITQKSVIHNQVLNDLSKNNNTSHSIQQDSKAGDRESNSKQSKNKDQVTLKTQNSNQYHSSSREYKNSIENKKAKRPSQNSQDSLEGQDSNIYNKHGKNKKNPQNVKQNQNRPQKSTNRPRQQQKFQKNQKNNYPRMQIKVMDSLEQMLNKGDFSLEFYPNNQEEFNKHFKSFENYLKGDEKLEMSKKYEMVFRVVSWQQKYKWIKRIKAPQPNSSSNPQPTNPQQKYEFHLQLIPQSILTQQLQLLKQKQIKLGSLNQISFNLPRIPKYKLLNLPKARTKTPNELCAQLNEQVRAWIEEYIMYEKEIRDIFKIREITFDHSLGVGVQEILFMNDRFELAELRKINVQHICNLEEDVPDLRVVREIVEGKRIRCPKLKKVKLEIDWLFEEYIEMLATTQRERPQLKEIQQVPHSRISTTPSPVKIQVNIYIMSAITYTLLSTRRFTNPHNINLKFKVMVKESSPKITQQLNIPLTSIQSPCLLDQPLNYSIKSSSYIEENSLPHRSIRMTEQKWQRMEQDREDYYPSLIEGYEFFISDWEDCLSRLNGLIERHEYFAGRQQFFVNKVFAGNLELHLFANPDFEKMFKLVDLSRVEVVVFIEPVTKNKWKEFASFGNRLPAVRKLDYSCQGSDLTVITPEDLVGFQSLNEIIVDRFRKGSIKSTDNINIKKRKQQLQRNGKKVIDSKIGIRNNVPKFQEEFTKFADKAQEVGSKGRKAIDYGLKLLNLIISDPETMLKHVAGMMQQKVQEAYGEQDPEQFD